jgi:hypothetical protein
MDGAVGEPSLYALPRFLERLGVAAQLVGYGAVEPQAAFLEDSMALPRLDGCGL